MANRRLRKELMETARGLYEFGAIDGKTTREFVKLFALVDRKGVKALA